MVDGIWFYVHQTCAQMCPSIPQPPTDNITFSDGFFNFRSVTSLYVPVETHTHIYICTFIIKTRITKINNYLVQGWNQTTNTCKCVTFPTRSWFIIRIWRSQNPILNVGERIVYVGAEVQLYVFRHEFCLPLGMDTATWKVAHHLKLASCEIWPS